MHAWWVYKLPWISVFMKLEVFENLLLIVSQTNGECQARELKLIPYQCCQSAQYQVHEHRIHLHSWELKIKSKMLW